MRIAILVASVTVAVISATVAGSAVVIRLCTVYKVDDVEGRPTSTSKSATVVRRPLSVTTDRRGRCITSIVGGNTSTRPTTTISARHPVSVAWADCTLSPAEDVDRKDQQPEEQTTNIDQHQFRMTIFPAAGCAYD